MLRVYYGESGEKRWLIGITTEKLIDTAYEDYREMVELL